MPAAVSVKLQHLYPMPYHVGRNGQQFGEFTEDEIREGLDRGTFLAGDLTWRDGMGEWKPLDQVFGFAAAHSLAAPMTALGPAAMGLGLPMEQPGNTGIGVMPTPGTAIASLVLGILSLVTCYFGVVFAIPGVVCGHVALSVIKRSAMPLEGRGLAVAGLVMNYLWLALAALVLVVLAIFAVIGAASA